MREPSRNLAAVLALFLLTSGVLPVASAHSMAEPAPQAHPQPGGPPLLWLRCGVFDPARESPPIPPAFTLSETQGYYIIQFDGPVTADRSAWLGSFCDVMAYLPDYAYVVIAGPGAVSLLRGHPGVRYVGLFQPGYKLDPSLGFTDDFLELSIVCFDRAQSDLVAGKLRALGAEIVSVDPTMIRARSPGALASSFAFIPEVQWVQEYHAPTLDNNAAAKISKVRTQADGTYKYGTDALWSYNATSGKYEGYAGANFTASSVDTGVDGTHTAFDGKKVAYYSGGNIDWYDYGPYFYPYFPHGTHTAGTMLGNGAYRSADPGVPGRYAGMAPLAGLVAELMYDGAGYYTWCNDAYTSGAVVQSNSWGGGYPTWGMYDDSAASYDSLVRDSDAVKAGNQSLTVCFSAGNDGGYGSGTVSPPSTAKNVISVGATDDSSGTSVAGFSSRGPTSDGRLKPDIVAPGESVTSCYGDSSYSYIAASGTSMSCPVVAGSSVLVNEYMFRNYGAAPSPALVKNLLINGADPIPGYSMPGNDQGWGRLDLARSLLNTTNRRIWFDDQKYPLMTGMARYYIVNVTRSSELKASLVWTDFCGTANAAKALVNDLDIVVTAPDGSVYQGNMFSGGYSAHNGTADSVNNVEMVRVAAPATGRWVVEVKGRNVVRGVQDFSLVVGGPFDQVSIARFDLAAANLTLAPADPAEGDNVRVDGSIDNIGDLPIKGIRYRFRVTEEDNVTQVLGQGIGSLPPLGAGETATVSENWTAVRGWTVVTLEADPYLEITEDNKSNNDAGALVLVRGFGLELFCDRPSIGVGPGETGNLSVTIHNRANTFDTFRLSVEGSLPAGWNAQVGNGSLHVGSGVNQTFNVSVTPPADALAGDYADFRVRAASEGNATYSRVIALNAVTDQVYDMVLASAVREGHVLPGRMITYPVSMTNAGNGIDSSEVGISGVPDGWGAYLSGTSFIVQPRDRQNLSLTVFAPARAPAEQTANITILAASGDNRSTSISIVTRVLQVTALELEVADGPDTVAAGSTAEYVIRVSNPGNGLDSFNLSAALDGGWTSEFSDQLPQIRAGDFTLDNLLISVPLDAQAGEHTFTVRGRSTSNTSVAFELEQSVFIDQYYGLTLAADETEARVETGNATEFILVLNNTGNGDDSFVLSKDDSLPRSWRMTLNPSTVHVPFNGSVQIMLKVRPPTDIPDGNYVFNIIGTSWNNPQKTASVRFRIHLVTPPAPPPPPAPAPTPTPAPEPEPGPSQNRYVVWIKDHWQLSLALLVLMIAAASGGAYARSRRRKEKAPARPAPPAFDGVRMAPSSYAQAPPPAPLPAPPPIEWEDASTRNASLSVGDGAAPPSGHQGAAAEPAPMAPPEETAETASSGPPEGGHGAGAPPAEERAGIPPAAGAGSVPAPAARRAVEDDIDEILAKIQDVSRK
jgi:uncharacterized membrane protein